MANYQFSMPLSDTDPVIERAIAAFNDRRRRSVNGRDGPREHIYGPAGRRNLWAELHEYTAELFEAFPDLRLEVKRVISSNDGAAALECQYVGTHEGPLEEIPPTGNSVVVPSMTVIDVSVDGITSWRDYWISSSLPSNLASSFLPFFPFFRGFW
ncbi:MAG: ester cyclase [Natrialbaceae archaeon]|nr:ester cyclase [Natrialbaceae archaeon]